MAWANYGTAISHEHIIRNEKVLPENFELHHQQPSNWNDDKFYKPNNACGGRFIPALGIYPALTSDTAPNTGRGKPAPTVPPNPILTTLSNNFNTLGYVWYDIWFFRWKCLQNPCCLLSLPSVLQIRFQNITFRMTLKQCFCLCN